VDAGSENFYNLKNIYHQRSLEKFQHDGPHTESFSQFSSSFFLNLYIESPDMVVGSLEVEGAVCRMKHRLGWNCSFAVPDKVIQGI
jgi:hypothetical protein